MRGSNVTVVLLKTVPLTGVVEPIVSSFQAAFVLQEIAVYLVGLQPLELYAETKMVFVIFQNTVVDSQGIAHKIFTSWMELHVLH